MESSSWQQTIAVTIKDSRADTQNPIGTNVSMKRRIRAIRSLKARFRPVTSNASMKYVKNIVVYSLRTFPISPVAGLNRT